MLLGFAVVDVNMRGTGCSGGAFNYFEPLQNLDAYDVIETVAHQPWVLHHRVGMMGISYGGISQLFAAATDPPDLAAISPLSVIDSTATTLYPGGLLNTGFALGWAEDRDHDALPASPTGGEPWAYKRIQEGDQTCKANQDLHGEAVNQVAKTRANSHYVPSVANPLDPVTFVHKIKVPVYLACQWTDEQVGGHCRGPRPALHRHRAEMVHVHQRRPYRFARSGDVHPVVRLPRAVRRAGGAEAVGDREGVRADCVPGGDGNSRSDAAQRPDSDRTELRRALAAFQRLPEVRILFDNGAGSSTPGAPVPAFEQSFSRFPLPGTRAESWYMGRGGALVSRPPAKRGADQFTWNAHALPPTDFTGDTGSGPGGLWTATPQYQWEQNPPGTALSYVSAPLAANTVVVGGGAVQAWIKASAPSVDLQVTVSEIRPDGKETFVQDGWLRANERKLARSSTLLEPQPTLRKADVRPLPRGRWTEVTIPLYYEGHVYRRGSRIRIVIAAPNGDQPIWAFADTRPKGQATVRLAYSRKTPSRLVLPVVPGINVPTGLPPCPGLRGEPCRAYQPFVNRSA